MNLELDINSCLAWQRTQRVHSNNGYFTTGSNGNLMVVTCFTARSYYSARVHLGTDSKKTIISVGVPGIRQRMSSRW
jgi:hypothetical protein